MADTQRISSEPARSLLELRNGIDAIDNRLLELINHRLELVQEVGRIKASRGRQVRDSAREQQIFSRLLSLNDGPLDERVLKQLFTQIMAASRQLQRPHRIAFLGPEATFTHIAAMRYFGHSVCYLPRPDIRDVFLEVEKNTCHYGVVPVENSIEGAVNHTLDLFFESDLKICAELYQPISHDLLSTTGRLKDIRVIYSHPQPFSQCRCWLRKYLPDVRLSECSSTARAARKAAGEEGAAAIASSEAARLYSLEVAASRIEDIARNTTRFLTIGKDDVHRTGNDKTSLMFVTGHVPGALYQILRPVAESRLNMLKLESRPTRCQNWSYFFFMDIEGHLEDEAVSKALVEMKKLCMYMKILGSYPKAEEF
ncbi:MAG: prephenate dehydratase [Desulfobacterales bacterium]|nr:MAG: prephenate dehydratase [Desulfobacterales bacterium]